MVKNFNYVPQSIYLFDTTIKKKKYYFRSKPKNFNENLFLNSIKISKIFDFM